jgi:hypothetical protein
MAAPLSWLEGLKPRSVSRRMRPGPRVSRALALAAAGSLTLASCEPETIALLPVQPSPAAGETAGDAGSGSGGTSGGDKPTAGETSGGNANGGSLGPGPGGNVSCVGLGCAGLNFGGFGGSSWSGNCNPQDDDCDYCDSDEHCPERWHCAKAVGLCVECVGPSDCGLGRACDLGIGRCRPACEDSIDCDEGSLCNLEHGTCVQCLNHSECDFDGDEDTRYCALPQHLCVECLDDPDCDDGRRSICVGGHCIECILDRQCGPDQYCDVARGRCEP